MRNLRDQKGFSLIELMIVVVIIGILAAIAIPRFSNISDRARQSEVDPVLRQIAGMQEMNLTDNGAYTTDLADLVQYGLGADVNAAAPTGAAYLTRYFSIAVTVDNTVTPSTFCLQATPHAATSGNAQQFDNGVGVTFTSNGVLMRGTTAAPPAC